PLKRRQSELDPVSARMLPPLFPDNPLLLTGLDALYLNSERVTELRQAQLEAITRWLKTGGHLIVAVESVSDVNSSPWLRSLVPVWLTGVRTVQAHPELQNWIRSRVAAGGAGSGNFMTLGEGVNSASPERPFADQADDMTFEASDLQVATADVLGGDVLVSCEGTPLIVQAPYGLGRVTVLLFSPEREPFRSWKSLPSLWSRLTEVNPLWYASSDQQNYGRWATDGIFGAMIDSRQIRKLPVGWLLLLLVAYLAVIGPFDRWWLRKIGKPMLTWITFPLYVVLFSGLIYVIGYKLRAGEREWNELHVVDVISSGAREDWRGRTYGSLYSPVNDTYQMRGPQKLAAFRGEAASTWGGGGVTEAITVVQREETFESEAYVPVWTSQLYVNDWWSQGIAPVKATVTEERDRIVVRLENTTDRALQPLRLVWRGRVFELGQLQPGEAKPVNLDIQQGVELGSYLANLNVVSFQSIIQQRRRAFGAAEAGRIDNLPDGCFVSSFLSEAVSGNPQSGFIAPPGTELNPALQDHALLCVWAEGQAAAAPMNAFTARRGQVNTFWRIAIPLNSKPQATHDL
ncbi:MAG: hypothetical protein MUC91_12135, partial [Verrucomicrobia bacterium]|nr:hypothetical protein [Verrucomicrobiota bacterium]